MPLIGQYPHCPDHPTTDKWQSKVFLFINIVYLLYIMHLCIIHHDIHYFLLEYLFCPRYSIDQKQHIYQEVHLLWQKRK